MLRLFAPEIAKRDFSSLNNALAAAKLVLPAKQAALLNIQLHEVRSTDWHVDSNMILTALIGIYNIQHTSIVENV